MRHALTIIGIWVLLAIVLSAAYSQWMWGYLFVRPSVNQEVAAMTKLQSITPVGDIGKSSPDEALGIYLDDLSGTDPYDDPYSHLESRSLFAAQRARQNLRSAARLSSGVATQLVDKFRRSGLTANSSEGYDSDAELRGIIVGFTGPSGESRLLLALRGGQVSNDHYPFYEVLIEGANPLSFRVLDSQMFYFDVAGLEGMEWPATFVMALYLSAPIVLIFAVLSLWRLRRSRQG